MANYIPVNIINTNMQSYCIDGIDCPVIEVFNYNPIIYTSIFIILSLYMVHRWRNKNISGFIRS